MKQSFAFDLVQKRARDYIKNLGFRFLLLEGQELEIYIW